MILNIIAVSSALMTISSVASAGNPGQTVQIKSSSNWCMMMPPNAGGDIAANEDRAIAFCTQNDPNAPGAKIFPSGFIQSANFESGDGYVQITGKIDSARYSLSEDDQGGQYDMKAPVGSSCAGYQHYVNLIEPHTNTYCIRCCKDKKDCNTGKSTYGCSAVIPGKYSLNSVHIQDGSSASESGSATATSTASPTSGGNITTSLTSTATVTGTTSTSSISTTITGTTTTASTPTETKSSAIAQSSPVKFLGAALIAAVILSIQV